MSNDWLPTHHIHTQDTNNQKDALANRSSGIISAFGVMGREIESRQYKELCLRMYVALKNHDILSNRRKLATVPTIVTWK
jgi:hypothetical protein